MNIYQFKALERGQVFELGSRGDFGIVNVERSGGQATQITARPCGYNVETKKYGYIAEYTIQIKVDEPTVALMRVWKDKRIKSNPAPKEADLVLI